MITALDPKTALVLIDLQNAIAGMQPAHPFNDIVEKSKLLIDAFREKQLPVVFVRVSPLGAKWTLVRADVSQLPKTEEAIREAKAGWDANGLSNIVSALEVKEDDLLITKHTWSAFPNTGLHDELQKRGITGIVLAGIATSIGVEGTARDASVLGYNLTFVTDAMSDLTMEAHEHSLSRIFPRIGELGTTEAVVAKIKE
ncbi:isochorismatase family protein [Mucilaginibacter sp. dw_454]|uniref:isochorismatase family protein n=1 Tax=Mucilaginibacter sp. dw_454 TaxID=2720079 RepID=UPI001BD38A63|nr:isochorismatase family protein [Mucilaginibacter sp. dw_454]